MAHARVGPNTAWHLHSLGATAAATTLQMHAPVQAMRYQEAQAGLAHGHQKLFGAADHRAQAQCIEQR